MRECDGQENDCALVPSPSASRTGRGQVRSSLHTGDRGERHRRNDCDACEHDCCVLGTSSVHSGTAHGTGRGRRQLPVTVLPQRTPTRKDGQWDTGQAATQCVVSATRAVCGVRCACAEGVRWEGMQDGPVHASGQRHGHSQTRRQRHSRPSREQRTRLVAIRSSSVGCGHISP
jgi:hypothetical protein